MGISQEELALESDHHRNYIGFLERGERCPNVATLEGIAEALGVRISELLSEAGYRFELKFKSEFKGFQDRGNSDRILGTVLCRFPF